MQTFHLAVSPTCELHSSLSCCFAPHYGLNIQDHVLVNVIDFLSFLSAICQFSTEVRQVWPVLVDFSQL